MLKKIFTLMAACALPFSGWGVTDAETDSPEKSVKVGGLVLTTTDDAGLVEETDYTYNKDKAWLTIKTNKKITIENAPKKKKAQTRIWGNVTPDNTINIELKNTNINWTSTASVLGTNGTINLTLTGENILTSTGTGAVVSGGTLKISGDGSLKVTGTKSHGIEGTSLDIDGGTITVNVSAEERDAINIPQGNINISGESTKVTANATGEGSRGIAGANIEISSGTVVANGVASGIEFYQSESGGSFTTGKEGSAHITTNNITRNNSDYDIAEQEGLSGIIEMDDQLCYFGTQTISSNLTLKEGQNLIVGKGATLTIAENVTVTVPNGSVFVNNGTATVNGTVSGDGYYTGTKPSGEGFQLGDKEKLKVTYHYNFTAPGSSEQTVTEYLVSGATLSHQPERPKYTFTGWYSAATDGDLVTTIDKTTEVYAHWKQNQVTFTWADEIPEVYYEEGAEIALPEGTVTVAAQDDDMPAPDPDRIAYWFSKEKEGTYKTNVPSEVGTWYVWVKYADENYEECVDTEKKAFSIVEAPSPAPAPTYNAAVAAGSADGVKVSFNHKSVKAGGTIVVSFTVESGIDESEVALLYKRGRSGDWKVLEKNLAGKYAIYDIFSDIYVKAVVGAPTAVEAIAASKIYAANGSIVVETAQPTAVVIVDMAGCMLANETVSGKATFGNLPGGIYVVQAGNETVKLSVRR